MSTATTTFPGLVAGEWTIDPAHTDVAFVARHLMVTKVRGRFAVVSGTVTVAEPITDSHVEVAIGVESVTTGSDDRDGHIRSADFFDAENFPTMTFKSTAFTGDTLVGDLTIKDVTKSVTLDVDFEGAIKDPWGNAKAGFEARTTINRTDWGLGWNVALEAGGVLVSEKVELVLDVQLLKA